MNTHESYVSLETAKMLKQAGFDWVVRAHYAPTEYTGIWIDSSYDNKWNGEYYNCFSAPTLAVAQRWLREVKHFDMDVYCLYNAKRFKAHASVSGRMTEDGEPRNLYYEDEFETYEHAQEYGIVKILTLINDGSI